MTAPTNPALPTLPMHLMLAMGCWLSSPFVLRCAKSVLPSLSSNSKNPQSHAQQLNQLESALSEEARQRANSLLSGILRYVESPYARKVQEPPVIWRKGNARLLDYGSRATSIKAEQPIVLLIPSLINRYYIFDLEEERSLVRYLAQQGAYPLVLDWGKPGDYEASFGCNDYITQILNPAIEFISKTAQQKIVLAGYCMGGVLSLAAAQLRSKYISALALFATPWDFHCKAFAPFILDKKWCATIEELILAQKQLPADVIQSMFYMTDPWVFEQKFRRFADLQHDSRAAKNFIALEHWVNDGVPMTGNVAKECLIGWAQHNALAKSKWKAGGKTIHPQKTKMPVFLAIPKNDHVVPFDCALPLSQHFKDATIIHPGSGHVSMMVGSTAKRELWAPFSEWVHSLAR